MTPETFTMIIKDATPHQQALADLLNKKFDEYYVEYGPENFASKVRDFIMTHDDHTQKQLRAVSAMIIQQLASNIGTPEVQQESQEFLTRILKKPLP
jgi:hypothetical protein